MPKIPEGATVPQDRKPKAKADKFDPTQPFTFETNGETFEIVGVLERMTGGWLRKYRNVEGPEASYAILEAACDPGTLEAIDAMPLRENAEFLARFDDYLGAVAGAELGESGRSSS